MVFPALLLNIIMLEKSLHLFELQLRHRYNRNPDGSVVPKVRWPRWKDCLGGLQE